MLEQRITSQNPQYGEVSTFKRAKTINTFYGIFRTSGLESTIRL